MTDATLTKIEPAGLKRFSAGKVRDIFDLGGHLLIVASDRISAFDVVLPQGIPQKGAALTQVSRFWFERTAALVPNHMVETDVDKMPEEVRANADILRGRSMLVKKGKVFPVECVVRGYIAGSGWKEYRKSGTVCGIKLPEGLRHGDRLEEPIFTPTTKAETGHDEPMTFEQMCDRVGRETAMVLRDKSIEVYNAACEYALPKGIIICDTKFEWADIGGEITLVDELLTPDSSRFWPAEKWTPGSTQESFDKQPVRDYLESIGWNKQPPPPDLPEEVVEQTSGRYREAYRRLTGSEL